MTIEEKMEHFKNVSLENASQKSNDILTAYKESLDLQFEKHKEEAVIKAKSTEESKLGAARLEAKREFAKIQADERRKITLHQNKLKADIFSEVNKKLDEYRKTQDYKTFLVKQIMDVLNIFPDTDVIFYIDPADAPLLPFLKENTGAGIELNQTSFMGGTKAIIESRNMLVDNSFKTKLSEQQEQFSITF